MCHDRSLFKRRISGLLVAGFFLFGVLQTCAQSTSASGDLPRTPASAEQMFSSYEGQNISSIEIAGQPSLDETQFSSLFAQKAGEPFSTDKVTQTAAAIQATGKFKDVHIQVDPEATGVRVMFILEPAVYFGVFEFPGAERFPYSRLIQVANYPAAMPYNTSEVEQDRQGLLTFYRQEGFFEAEVKTDLKLDAAHAVTNIEFPAKLGRHAKFGTIEIAGLPNDEQQHLQDSLKSLLARARTLAIRPGKTYHHSTLIKATQYLQTELQKKGLLGAQVTLEGAEYHADTNRADIHFNVKPGPKISVEITGARVWSCTARPQ